MNLEKDLQDLEVNLLLDDEYQSRILKLEENDGLPIE
jgi:hypothetical protein